MASNPFQKSCELPQKLGPQHRHGVDDGHAAIQNGAYMEQSGASSEGNSSDSDIDI